MKTRGGGAALFTSPPREQAQALRTAAAALGSSLDRSSANRAAVFRNLAILVSAEVIAFALLQKSTQSASTEGVYTAAAVGFMLIVPFCFKAILKSGESIAIANLYWIVLSLILGALLSIIIFQQKITHLQIAGMGVAVVGAVVAFFGEPKE
jgi:drug/metabolite transporter (DMT)-like permease